MELRPISKEYTEILSDKYNMSLEDINKLITQSDSELFENKFFKMYVIMIAELIVGTISIYEHSANVVSIGPDIFEEYRQCGYATEAMKAIMDIAKAKGYKVVFQQIRTNNTASIALHTKLGFETDNCIFKNKNDNEVSIYLKPV